MNSNEAYEVTMRQLCMEADQIAESIQKNKTMSTQDLEKLDKIYHLKKSMLTAKAMEDAEGYSMDGVSGYRGRAANGRFVSRAQGGNSYTDGYEQGYSEAMSQANGYSQGYSEAMSQMRREQNGESSGHYSMPPYMPRRW